MITFTDEDGGTQTADVTSTAAGNLLTTGADGGSFIDQAAIATNETTTSLAQNDTTGVITFTDEDGGTQTADVTSTAAGNLLTTGADGGSFIDQAAIATNETTTSLAQNDTTGVITFTDEDGGTQTADVTSTAAGNLLTTGADGGSFIDQAAIATNENSLAQDDDF